jgi:DNA-binding protein HU-beta
VEEVMNAAGLETKRQAEAVVEAVFDTITKALSRGEEVAVSGFGTFKVSKRAARTGINPRTGAKVQIPAKTVPKFTAGKALKEAVR